MKKYSCMAGKKVGAECTEKWAKANIHTPDMDPLFTHTHKMLHYTIVFQVFVFLQIFNLINARKIGDGEMNVFSGFFNNKMFIIVLVLTILI